MCMHLFCTEQQKKKTPYLFIIKNIFICVKKKFKKHPKHKGAMQYNNNTKKSSFCYYISVFVNFVDIFNYAII